MTEAVSQTAISQACALLVHYSFDLYGYSASEIIDRWLQSVQAHWVRLAVVEALYQGRYKSVSVEQILALWQRRGQPLCHFNGEFERIVCSKLPGDWSAIESSVSAPAIIPETGPEPQDEAEPEVIWGAPLSEPLPRPCVTLPFSEPPQSIYQADWSKCQAAKQPIQQFVPKTEESPFYSKLQAVARSSAASLEA
ncbi:MAG: hypothetical protein LRZ84_24890 [Desertifilum sp.]|nr:hypothetical protein [Desertifilum sp.]